VGNVFLFFAGGQCLIGPMNLDEVVVINDFFFFFLVWIFKLVSLMYVQSYVRSEEMASRIQELSIESMKR